MKKVFRINPLIFTAILFLAGCTKDQTADVKEYKVTHWPVVKTLKATSSKVTKATLNGTVNCSGLSTTVTFEYGTTTSYDSTVTASQSPVTGEGIINVSADISNLTPSTTYHFRVKADNSKWINFCGSDSAFITSPATTTLYAINVDSTTARLKGTVNGFLGLSTIVTFEYGTTKSYGNTVTVSQTNLEGDSITNVSADISGLDKNSTYHFRIKAENPLWIFYGSDKIFYTITSGTDVDGNVYKVVTIGTQVWMAENLKTTKYNDGMPIPNTTDSTAWYCDYNNSPDNATTYGRLYNWYTVAPAFNGGKNICPTGWHVPTDSEWTTLTTYLGGDTVAGGKLKEYGTTHWATPNTGATNESGFTALPGGHHFGEYLDIGSWGYWWSSTPVPPGAGWIRMMSFSFDDVWRGLSRSRNSGMSVRCVKDN
jgi:uncharacterized protein (TIGR02145 family)